MKFFRLDLLTLLISLFILNSCKNPDGVGLDVNGEDQLSGTLFADTTVTLNTAYEDSVQTSDIGRNALAYFTDPELGVTESNIITNINLPSGLAYTVPEGTITIDSAILGIKYDPNGFYGDSVHSVYKVNVHTLSEKPLASSPYYNTKLWRYDPDPIGTKTFNARPHDTLRITSIVKDAPDTTIRVLPQVRIPLSTNFIRSVLFTDGNQIKSNDNFQTAVKGFYLTLDKTGTTTPGGIISFGVPDTVSVYIRVTNGSTIDTSVVSLALNRHISEIKHTYSVDVLTAINNTESNPRAYLQGMGGLRVKVGFPGLKDLPKDIIINRAELVVSPYPGTLTPYAPLPKLTMYKLDLAKQRSFIEDMVGTYTNVFGGSYGIPIKDEYRFLLTTYIQNMVSGKTKDYGTFIAAASEATGTATTTDINPTAYPIARTILAGKNSPYRVKLNIIYTKIK